MTVFEQSEIRKKFVGTNFMTPDVIKYGKSKNGKYIYEVAEGRGIKNNLLFAVAVRTKDGLTSVPKLTDIFYKRQDALDYADSL